MRLDIGLHPNVWGKYVNSDSILETRTVTVDGKKVKLIFHKSFTPDVQIARYLDDLNHEVFKKGVHIAQVGEQVQFKQDGWSLEVVFTYAIGQYIDKKKYVTRTVTVDGKKVKLIFHKSFTPDVQIARYLDDLNPEVFKKGVHIAQVGEQVQFKQDGWSLEAFHHAIGGYIEQEDSM